MSTVVVMDEQQRKIARDALKEFISLFDTQNDISELAEVTPAAISSWKRRGYVPLYLVEKFREASNGRISKKRFRPDIYG